MKPIKSTTTLNNVIPTKIPERNNSFIYNNSDLIYFMVKLKLLLEHKEGLNSNTKKSVKCSIYLIKIKTNNNKFIHFIYDSRKQTYYSKADSKNELPKLKDQIRWNYSSGKICDGITVKFVNKEFYTSDISISLFNKNDIDYTLCGLLLLNNLKQNGMYLNLICSLQKVGGYLLALSEDISKHFNKTHIFLRSLGGPMPVYIHKGYEFIDGNDSLNIKESHINFRNNPKGVISKKSKYYESQYNLKFIKSIIPNYIRKSKRTKKVYNNHILFNINGNKDDGWDMYKNLTIV